MKILFVFLTYRFDDGSPFFVIDTPGLGDSDGRDSMHIAKMADALKRHRSVHLFVLVFNGQDPRLSIHMQGMLGIFSEMFGAGFLDNACVLFTRWYMDQASLRRRQKAGDTKEKRTLEFQEEFTNRFGCPKPIPCFFLDCNTSPGDEEEVKLQLQELKELKALAMSKKRFECLSVQDVLSLRDRAERKALLIKEEAKAALKLVEERRKTELEEVKAQAAVILREEKRAAAAEKERAVQEEKRAAAAEKARAAVILREEKMRAAAKLQEEKRAAAAEKDRAVQEEKRVAAEQQKRADKKLEEEKKKAQAEREAAQARAAAVAAAAARPGVFYVNGGNPFGGYSRQVSGPRYFTPESDSSSESDERSEPCYRTPKRRVRGRNQDGSECRQCAKGGYCRWHNPKPDESDSGSFSSDC